MYTEYKNHTFSVPPWVKTTDVAVWVSDQFGDICYLNSKAEKLLGYTSSECLGLPCYSIICGVDVLGNPQCAPVCPISLRSKHQLPIDPMDIYINNSKGLPRKIKVLVITLQHPDKQLYWLIHCAINDDKGQKIENYWKRVVSRSPNNIGKYVKGKHPHLSKREEQILQLLSADKSMKAIAFELHVSYATIRNHVHHILSKLEVHSIVEAIAFTLLEKQDSIKR